MSVLCSHLGFATVYHCKKMSLVYFKVSLNTHQTLSSGTDTVGVCVGAPCPIMHHLVHKHHLPSFLRFTA